MRLHSATAFAALLIALLLPRSNLLAQDQDTLVQRPQPRSQPGWSLSRTMREFIRDVARPVGYFPTRGTWDYVTEVRDRGGRKTVGTHRFPAAQTWDAVERPDGPLCNMFSSGDGVVFPSVVGYAYESRDWRRVVRTRFEPRPADARVGVWVDWRREDGRWVISTVGEWIQPPPRVLGIPAAQARDTLRGRRLQLPLPPGARLATDAPWYAGETLHLSGPPYLKQPRTRKMEPRSLVYYATVDGVTVWTEPWELASGWGPSVVYVPVDREGVFLPYVSWRGNGCSS